MRLFVAAYPSGEALDDLARVVDDLLITKARDDGINARVTARPLWHVTLAFLGEVADAKASQAARALDRAVEQIGPVRPVLRLAGGGRFGRGRFTLLWVGLGGDVAALTKIADVVRRELHTSRLPYDTKRFAAHLTIARPGDRLPDATIAADLTVLGEHRGPQWRVRSIELVASHLGPQPRHEIIHSAPLA
jgi:2'-5' RNA ligase